MNRLSLFLSLCAIGALSFTADAVAQGKSQSVRGYVKKDGTYVSPHRRSKANHTRIDNYSTKGNVNPYTGKKGSVSTYPSSTYKKRWK